MGNIIQSIPEAKLLLASLRSVGYTEETAIADIVDNCTYRLNHPGVEVLGDVCSANYSDIMRKYGAIDVVIGGPPCQGFSNANRQKNHAISQNNMLVKQYLRAILELQPKAFVMENVSMLSSEVHRFYMEKRDEETIERCNIPVKDTLLHLLDAKFMFEKALTIVQSEKEISKYLWAEEDYYLLNVIYKASRSAAKMQKALDKHKKKLLKRAERYLTIAENDHVFAEAKTAFQAVVDFYEGRLAIDRIKDKIEPSIMIQRMLSKAQEIFENNIVVDKYVQDNGLAAQIRSFAVYDYLKKILEAPENDYVIYSDVLCAADYGAPQKRMRFVVIGIKRKILRNVERDKKNTEELKALGWNVITVWECELKRAVREENLNLLITKIQQSKS